MNLKWESRQVNATLFFDPMLNTFKIAKVTWHILWTWKQLETLEDQKPVEHRRLSGQSFYIGKFISWIPANAKQGKIYLIKLLVTIVMTYCFRQLVKHVFQTFLPTTIIVSISWLSFLIPPTAYPGRMGMLVVLCLVIINIMLKVVEVSPKSSGICGLTLWTIICLIMVGTEFQVYFFWYSEHNMAIT